MLQGLRACSWMSLLLSCICLSDSSLTCKLNYRVQRYQRTVISCQYDRSFYEVRWYFNDAETSFLRRDRNNKYGSGLESGEYDITDDGSLIIVDPDIKHEGTYTVTVLHENGRSSRADIEVYIIVTLDTLTIEDCNIGASSEYCERDKGSHFLVCVARDAHPKVDLRWLDLGPEGMRDSNKPQTSSVFSRNDLYTTVSKLDYSDSNVAFQYFMCVAAGYAADGNRNVSSLVVSQEVYIPSNKHEKKTVDIGDSFTLVCPETSYQLGQIEATLTDGYKMQITESGFPNNEGTCVDDETCKRTKSGHFEITVKEETQTGLYVCISSNGNVTRKSETDITVSPLTSRDVLIKECKGQKNCTLQPAMSGTLTCSVSGVRQSVQLIWEELEPTGNIMFTSINETKVSDVEFGNSTSLHIISYRFQNCGEMTTFRCSAKYDNDGQSTRHSYVFLNTDTSCSSGGSSAAIVVIVVPLIIIIVVAAVIVLVRKNYVQVPCRKEVEDGEEEASSKKLDATNIDMGEEIDGVSDPLLEMKAKSITQEAKADSTEIEMEVEKSSVSDPMLGEKATSTTQKPNKRIIHDFQRLLKKCIKEVKKNKKGKRFEEFLTNFENDYEPNLLQNLHLIATQLKKKDAVRVVEYLGDCSKKWTGEYVEIARDLLTKKKMTIDQFVPYLTKSSTYSTATPDILLRLLSKNAITSEDILRFTCKKESGKDKIFYLHFVIPTLQRLDEDCDSLGMLSLSKAIIAQNMPSKITTNEISCPEDVRKKYLQMILLCLDKEQIDWDTYSKFCNGIIADDPEKQATYHKVLLECSTETWIKPEVFLKCLSREVEDKRINPEFLTRIYYSDKISFSEYVDMIVKGGIPFNDVSHHLTSPAMENKTPEKLSKVIIQFFQSTVITEDDVISFIDFTEPKHIDNKEQVKDSVNEVAFQVCLHYLHNLLTENQSNENLRNLFHRICNTVMESNTEGTETKVWNTLTPEQTKEKFQEVLLFSLTKEKIYLKEYLRIIEQSMEAHKIQEVDFTSVLLKCSEKTWITGGTLNQVLLASLEKSLLTDTASLVKIVINAFFRKVILAEILTALIEKGMSTDKPNETMSEFVKASTDAYVDDKVTEAQLVEITKHFITQKKVTVGEIFKGITSAAKAKQIPIEAIVTAVSHFYTDGNVSFEDLQGVLDFESANNKQYHDSSDKMSYLYFLHSIHQSKDKNTQKLYRDVLVVALKKLENVNDKTKKELYEEKDTSKTFIRLLLVLRLMGTITATTHEVLLRRGSKINLEEYEEVLETDSSKVWLEPREILNIVQHDHSVKLVRDSTFTKIVVKLFINEKITKEKFSDVSKELLSDNEESFQNIYDEFIRSSKNSEKNVEIIINGILQYCHENMINHEVVLDKINFTKDGANESTLTSDKIPFVKFLMTTFVRLEEENLKDLFKVVATQGLSVQGQSGKDAARQLKDKGPFEIFVYLLLHSVTSKVIIVQTFVDIAKALVTRDTTCRDVFFKIALRTSMDAWMLVDDLKTMSKECLKENVITVEQYVELLTNVYIHARIDEKDFVLTTIFLLEEKKTSIKKIFQQLKRSADEHEVKDRCVPASLQYYITIKNVDLEELTNAMRESYELHKSPLQELSDALLDHHLDKRTPDMMDFLAYRGVALKNKIPYPYILESIQHRTMLQKGLDDALHGLFKNILDEAMEKEGPSGKEIRQALVSPQSLIPVFLKALFFSVEKEMIDSDQCMDILLSSVDGEKISKAEYEIALKEYTREVWMTTKSLTKIFCNSLKQEWITDETLCSELQKLLKSKKLKFPDYNQILEECLSKKILTENCFKETVLRDIGSNETYWETWMKDITSLSQKNLISKDVRTELLNAVIKRYSVSKNDAKPVLDTVLTDIEERRLLTADLKFPGMMKRARKH